MIIYHAFIKVKSEHRETFLDLVKNVIAGSQAEEGNISYNLYEDTQQENTFVMLEEWKDQQATEFHVKTPHYKSFSKNVSTLLAGPVQLKRFEATEIK
nr:putative quinol monooxygenase [Neobacillus sp. Marseille-Q6967]